MVPHCTVTDTHTHTLTLKNLMAVDMGVVIFSKSQCALLKHLGLFHTDFNFHGECTAGMQRSLFNCSHINPPADPPRRSERLHKSANLGDVSNHKLGCAGNERQRNFVC